MKYRDGINRRDLLQLGVLGGAGLTLSNFLRLAAAEEVKKLKPTADAVIFVNLDGGPSHLDTLDMKPEAPAETQGEFKPIQTKIPGLTACEHLPKFAAMADKFTLIRGIHHSAGDHPQGQSYISTGNRPTPALVYPSLGSVVAKEATGSAELPSYVAVPATEWNAGYLGDAYAPFKTNAVPQAGTPFSVRGIALSEGITLDKINRRQQLLEKVNRRFREAELESPLLEALDKFSGQAHSMITSDRSREAFDVGRESRSVQERFTADDLNQSLLLACRLVEFGSKFITISNSGWDTHLDNFAGHKRLLGPLDNGLPALVQTLEEKGLLERTLVVVMGEFGRTPKINQNVGRDHYPRANWCLMAGGGVRPGQLIGGTDKAGAAPDSATDIQPDDLVATIYHSLGIHPRSEYYTRTGRPVMLVPNGRVMGELFS